MGYYRHHAIIVTGKQTEIGQAYVAALDLLLFVSDLSDEAINGYRSFCVFPDGSKEEAAKSLEFDKRRNRLIERLASYRPHLDWVEVQFGGDETEAAVTRCSG